MNLLVIGDPHFRIDNMDESRVFVQELEKYLATNHATFDYIIVLGDVLHTHEKLHTFALNAACDFLKMLTRHNQVYCLVGNHDATSNTIFLTDNHWMNALKGWDKLTIVDTPLTVVKDSKQICLCPYVPDGRFVEALDTIGREVWMKSACIFAHQGLNGAKMGAIVMQGVEEWIEDYPMLISGHIHDKQWVKSNLFYAGSSMQHAFGESEDKSLSFVSIQSQCNITDIILPIKKKKILYIEMEDIDTQMVKALEKLQKSTEGNIEYKVVVKGSQEELKSFKKSKDFKNLEKISKKVQLKTLVPQVERHESESASKTVEEARFVDILFNLVTDHYETSFLSSVINGTEDLSDKDVFVIKK
jgi:DNA repair exonuclease SbcCD nuclease subunit